MAEMEILPPLNSGIQYKWAAMLGLCSHYTIHSRYISFTCALGNI